MSRESAREAGGRTRSTRGCCAAPPLTPPAEHLLRAGRWDTHPFNAGRASLLHVTYAPPKPGPGSHSVTLQNHSSLQPGPFPGAGQPGLRCARPRACLPNTRPPTSQSAPALPPLSPHAPLSCGRPLGGSRPSPVGGQAPRGGRRAASVPVALACTASGQHVWSVRPPRSVCPGSRAGPRAHAPPGTTCVQVGGLQPGDVGIRKCWLCLQRRFLFLLLQPWMVCLL